VETSAVCIDNCTVTFFELLSHPLGLPQFGTATCEIEINNSLEL
jgi:hypothetical protein